MSLLVEGARLKSFLKYIILAGGYGGRLQAHCDPTLNPHAMSKTIAAVGAKRCIEYPLEAARKLAEDPKSEVHVAVWHLAATVQQVISDRNIRYVTERYQDPLDTAGPVASITKRQGWDAEAGNIVIVQSGDIVHNVPLEDVVALHLQNHAAATLVATPVPWDQVARFGTLQLEGMPKRGSYKSEMEFEQAVRSWILDRQGKTLRLSRFVEKADRASCLSNLSSVSIYAFNVAVIRSLMNMMTKKGKDEPLFPDQYKGGPVPFSDWGHHIFPWFLKRAQRGMFPFYAYVLPEKYPSGTRSYFRDIGLPEDIRLANMDALDEKFEAGFGSFDKVEWGWRGKNTHIDESAKVSNSFIGNDCVIGKNVRLDHAVVGSNTIIEEESRIYRSVLYPRPYGREESNRLRRGTRVLDSLFLGVETDPETLIETEMAWSPSGGVSRLPLTGASEKKDDS
jgi:NDP-sugar pyrophosphorylase family protein